MLTIASRDGKVKILKFAESELGLMLEPAEMVTIDIILHYYNIVYQILNKHMHILMIRELCTNNSMVLLQLPTLDQNFQIRYLIKRLSTTVFAALLLVTMSLYQILRFSTEPSIGIHLWKNIQIQPFFELLRNLKKYATKNEPILDFYFRKPTL